MSTRIYISGASHVVLHTSDPIGRQWIDLFVCPEHAAVRGPHSRHTVPRDWWNDGNPRGVAITGGHRYSVQP